MFYGSGTFNNEELKARIKGVGRIAHFTPALQPSTNGFLENKTTSISNGAGKMHLWGETDTSSTWALRLDEAINSLNQDKIRSHGFMPMSYSTDGTHWTGAHLRRRM
ncbi:hypothetical protein BT69DRAFT_1329311 [Atractiella rhizophila]|nr:hypothetical protein BT69DRAFT_1329311 [Atractiella rhizophila]